MTDDAPRDAERLDEDSAYDALAARDATIRDLRVEVERLDCLIASVPCPHCFGTGGCDHTLPEKLRAIYDLIERSQPATPSPLLDIPPECDPNCNDPECPYIHQWTSSRTASDGGPSEENHLHLSMWERVAAGEHKAESDMELARGICEPLLYQRPCTGDDIENPGLLLWRRDYDKLCERIAAALTAARAEGRVIIGEPEAPTDDIDRLLFAIHYELSWDEAREKIAARCAEGERAMREQACEALRSCRMSFGNDTIMESVIEAIRALPTTEKKL